MAKRVVIFDKAAFKRGVDDVLLLRPLWSLLPLRHVLFWVFVVAVVYAASYLPDLLGYAE